jgi:hypothetical protein|tara:strand:- start:268 stop:438 length:171 start_codon:yes stop_codon:yes gene_type:complete
MTTFGTILTMMLGLACMLASLFLLISYTLPVLSCVAIGFAGIVLSFVPMIFEMGDM